MFVFLHLLVCAATFPIHRRAAITRATTSRLRCWLQTEAQTRTLFAANNISIGHIICSDKNSPKFLLLESCISESFEFWNDRRAAKDSLTAVREVFQVDLISNEEVSLVNASFKQTISFSSEIGFLHSLNSQLPKRKIWNHFYRPITTLKITTKTPFGLWKVVLSPLVVSKRAFSVSSSWEKLCFAKEERLCDIVSNLVVDLELLFVCCAKASRKKTNILRSGWL